MSQSVLPLLTETANKYGLDPNTFTAISWIESKHNPSAQNPSSSAGGLFQFIDSTWEGYGQGRDKMDAAANADAGARLMRDNIMFLRRKLGRNPTPGEVYLAHQQGAGGAAKILSNANMNAVELLGYDRVALNVPASMKSRVNTMTAGEFASLWDQKIQGAMGGVRPYEAVTLSPSLDPNSNPGFTVYDAMNPQKTNMPVTAIQPMIPIEEQRKAAIQREMEEQAPGWWQGTKDAAYSQNWMFMRDIQDAWAGEEIFKAEDPNWRPTADDLKVKFETSNIPMEYWDNFDEATSEAHLDSMISRTQRIIEADQRLAQMGTGANVGLRMGVALMDPVNWAVTAAVGAATMGTGAAPALAARLGVSARAASIGLGVAEGVAGNLLADTLQQADNMTFQTSDYLYSLGSGMVMGGAFGAFGKNVELAQQIEQIGRNVQQEAQEAVMSGSSAGAAQVMSSRPSLPTETSVMRAQANELAKALEIEPVGKNFRFDISSAMQSSKSGLIKLLGRGLVGDPVGPKKGMTAEIGVDEISTQINRQKETQWATEATTQWKNYAKRKGIKGRDKAAEEVRFREAITDYIWTRDPAKRAEFDPEVKALGDHFARIMGDWTDLLNNPGALDGTVANPVRGAGNLQRNPNYAPRIHDLEAIRDAVSRYGFEKIPEAEVKKLDDGTEVVLNQADMDQRGGLTRLVSKAMQDANPELPVRIANKFAYGYLKKLYTLSAGEEIPLHRILAGEDLDGLRRMLTELTDDVMDKRLFSDEEIEEFVQNFQKPNTKEGASSRLKNRALLNELTEMKLYNIDTGAMEAFTFKNLLIRDAHFLMSVYNRQMSGRVALARWKVPDGRGGYLVDGVDSDASFDSLLRRVRQVGMEDGLSKGEVDLAVKRFQFLYNHIVGYPQYDMGNTFYAGLKLLGDYNFVRVMGQVGFAQIPELMNVAANAGLKVFFQSMPAARDLWRNAKTGKLNTKLAQEVENVLGLGTDWVRNSWHLTTDDAGLAFNQMAPTSKLNRALTGVDAKLHKAKRAVSAASGMAPINTLLQRWNGQAIFYRFNQMANKAISKDGTFDVSKLRKRDLNRLKGLGLSDDMLKRVFTQIKNNRQTSKGMLGEKIEALNIRQWDDIQAAAAFERAAFRLARTIVMENDIGQMAMWMSHPVARAVFQFRSFMLGAHTKILLRGLNYRDAETFYSFAASAFVGSMVYTTQTYLNSIGRADQAEFLQERLSLAEMAKGGILRSSWFSTMAIPADLGHYLWTGNPLTNYRTTGLATGFFGNPTVDLIDGVVKGVGGVVEMAGGNAYSRPDAQALRSILPFQNLMGITQIFNLLTSGLPKYEEKN